jgi:hypothetical protein
MSKISELSDGGSLLATDDLIVVRSGGNVRARLSGVTDLSVSTKVTVTGTSSSLNLMESDTTDTNHRIRQNGGDLVIQKVSDDLSTVNNRLLVSGSTGDISFYNTTGQATLTWDASAESLGIGTSSPSAPLDIVSSATGGTTLELDNTSTGGRNYTLYSSGSGNSFGAGNFALYDADAAAVRLLVDSSGNVGIGTSTVNRALEIAGNNNGGAKANYIRITDTDTSATANNQQGGIEFFTNDPTAGICASIEVLYAGSGGGGEITFNTNSNSGGTLTEAMRIDESGNVGIGETAPLYKLDVNGANTSGIVDVAAFTNPVNAAGTGHGARILLHATQNAGRGVAIASSSSTNYATDNHMLFYTSASSTLTERMRIDSSGNVGIGVTPEDWTVFNPVLQIGGGAIAGSSATNFRVFSNTYYDGSYKRIATGAVTQYEQADGLHVWYSNASGSADSTFTPDEHMRIDSSGNLLVGTTNTYPADNNATGHSLTAVGQLQSSVSGFAAFIANRKSSRRITNGYFHMGHLDLRTRPTTRRHERRCRCRSLAM